MSQFPALIIITNVTCISYSNRFATNKTSTSFIQLAWSVCLLCVCIAGYIFSHAWTPCVCLFCSCAPSVDTFLLCSLQYSSFIFLLLSSVSCGLIYNGLGISYSAASMSILHIRGLFSIQTNANDLLRRCYTWPNVYQHLASA